MTLGRTSAPTHAVRATGDRTPQPGRSRSLRSAALIFIAAFGLLHWGWSAARDSWLERLVVEQMTVTPAAALVRMLTPAVDAQAVGASIKAPGGGLNILNGCEGTEVMFLLVAAFCALRLTARQWLLGLPPGLALVFALNQGRILALFYAYRTDRAVFDMLHTTVLPVVLVALVALSFHAFVHGSDARRA